MEETLPSVSPRPTRAWLRLHLHPRVLWAVILTVAAVIAWGVVVRIKGEGTFTVVHPTRGPIVEAIYGLGTVHATRVFGVKVGVTTSIREIQIEEGQSVKKGQLLIRFDENWIRAPWDGVVTSLSVNTGENVLPGVPVLTISDPGDNYMVVTLEQQDALRVRPGQVARISFETLRDRPVSEVVKEIYSKDEQQFNVKIPLKHLPAGVLPGMTADVSLEVGRRENALLVPQAAVHQGKILVRHGFRFVKVPCRVGVNDGRFVEILSPDLEESAEIQVPKPALNQQGS